MKVGTDGVLLGAWATVLPEMPTAQNEPAEVDPAYPSDDKSSSDDAVFSVLDIGTGTGLIAMMIAQRNNSAKIDAIDIDRDACIQAIENIEKSPFRNRIKVIHQSLANYSTEKKYDLIISNPPFFNNSLKSPDEKRNVARHNVSLSLKELIERAIPMLSENGRIALILPIQLSKELDFIITTHKLYITRRTDVIPVEGAQPKRVLIEISAKNAYKQEIKTETLTLATKNRKRTEPYQKLTDRFYL
ncbi:MAG: methyltransferase [Tannerella sp.]|jgi:tRNA1Val (adenine37-N6)-methyltransferase|nr:methyltransferase [Tannerella sp.]